MEEEDVPPPPPLLPAHNNNNNGGGGQQATNVVGRQNKRKIRSSNMTYGCQCGRKYTTKSAMNYHRKWICSNLERFLCQHCDYKAKRFYCFKEHLVRKHNVQPMSKHVYLAL